MEASRAFITNHTSRRGHKTEVIEAIQPAVVREQIRPSRHEIITEAVDRESHQHHYHTVVQPLRHSVTLPTRHTHNLVPAKHLTFQHDDVEATKQRVAADAALFRSSSVTHPTTHTQKYMPMVIGTHHHHHVHETVQPVIYKETIVPEIVHTTIPIHERHHLKAIHHPMSALAARSMAEFEALKVKTRGMTHYDGPPREYESKLHTTFEKLGLGLGSGSGSGSGLGMGNTATPSPTRRDNNMTINTSPRRKPVRRQSGSSASSASSLSSMEQPMTPRTPRVSNTHSKPMGNLNNTTHNNNQFYDAPTDNFNTTPTSNFNTSPTANYSTSPTANYNTTPTKHSNIDRPVQIVGNNSPRVSDESYGSGGGRRSSGRIRRF